MSLDSNAEVTLDSTGDTIFETCSSNLNDSDLNDLNDTLVEEQDVADNDIVTCNNYTNPIRKSTRQSVEPERLGIQKAL